MIYGNKYNNINNVLSIANALYIRDTYSEYVKDEYKNILATNYNAEIKYDVFKNAKNINNWIENKTFGQIKNMLRDEIVTNPDNEMFLINAILPLIYHNSIFFLSTDCLCLKAFKIIPPRII